MSYKQVTNIGDSAQGKPSVNTGRKICITMFFVATGAYLICASGTFYINF